MPASLPCLFMCFTFGKCPQTGLGNVQSEQTIMTRQQSSRARSLGPAKILSDKKETGQWNNMALWENENDCIVFFWLRTHLG